jgi:3-mercaptopyruvate sulfurtransferase SseA
MHKWLIAAAGSMLLASIASGQYKSNPAPAAPAQAAPAPAPAAPTPVMIPSANPPADPNEEARRITRDEGMEMVKSGKAVWVDVRAKDQFDLEHIKGAVNYPLADLQNDLEKKAAESKLPKGKFLITYCS